MPWLPNRPPRPQFWGSLLFLLLIAGPCAAAPPAPQAASAKAAAPMPDYGGRDAPVVPTDAAGSAVPNPAAQAGRSIEALVIVLAGVVGILYLIKRAGLAGDGSAPLTWGKGRTKSASVMSVAGSPFALTVVQSQTLPGGATLHLLSVNDETLLLLGATTQGVSLIAQWDQDGAKPAAEEAWAEKASFDDYLQRVGIAPAPSPARAAEERIGATADRLQSLLARSRARTPEETRR